MRPTDRLLDLASPASWPGELLACLEKHYDLFLTWETGEGAGGAQEYDAAIDALQALLDGRSLVGWHCTRLTTKEASAIAGGGMQLPDGAMLHRRLDVLARNGILDGAIVNKLKAANQADDANRAGMVWFCFYHPRLAGESGIHRFFRHWGGEALYNSHEGNPETGGAIAHVGRPCLVEAAVPIGSLSSPRTAFNVVRRYLVHRGFETEEPLELEAPARRPLPASAIRQLVFYPGADFGLLTGCDNWRTPLDAA